MLTPFRRRALGLLLLLPLLLVGCDSDGEDDELEGAPLPSNVVTVSESEPNDDLSSYQVLDGAGPFLVLGRANSDDGDSVSVGNGAGLSDDLEDFYALETQGAGPVVTLSAFSEDLDLYVFGPADASGNVDLAGSSTGAAERERVDASQLAPGVYLIAVSFFDARGATGQTDYRLLIE